MSSRFRLPNGAIANYPWGSHIPRFPAALVNTRTLPRNLAALTNALAGWDDDAQFRAKIAFEHEIVHYLQDILTGVGHWDFIAKRQYTRECLSIARFYTYLPTSVPPFESDLYAKHKADLRDRLIMTPSPEQPPWRREFLASKLSWTVTVSTIALI